MKVVVLGGTGFMGPYVVRYLCEMGHDVTIFHTGAHEPDLPEEVRHVHSDMARSPIMGVPDELRELEPDVVLHMVPIGERDARAVVVGFRGVAGRLVAVSSQDVYRVYNRLRGVEPGPPDAVPVTEESPLREKLYPYREDRPRGEDDHRRWLDDYDKILVERAVMGEPDLPGTVLRLPMVYGPGDRQHRIFEYLRRMDDGRPAILLDEGLAQWRAPRGYVENVAWAIALAVSDERAARRIYNVAEVDAVPEAEWVRRIGRVVGWEGRVVVVPKGRMPAQLFTEQHWDVDSSRIRRELGYREIVEQEEALKRTVEYERANPPEGAELNYSEEDTILEELEGRAG